jgi:acyl-CoA dehydrogenase
MDRLFDWLPANLPANDETVLVHGDYRLDNMIFDATEPRVLGIIDWEISTLGDPLAELAYLCMLWRTPKDWGGLLGQNLDELGLPTEAEMVGYYSTLSNRSVPEPALWEFYMAYNLFRVSCIRQGVYARSLDGTAANVRAAESGKLVKPAADLAWAIVSKMSGAPR